MFVVNLVMSLSVDVDLVMSVSCLANVAVLLESDYIYKAIELHVLNSLLLSLLPPFRFPLIYIYFPLNPSIVPYRDHELIMI